MDSTSAFRAAMSTSPWRSRRRSRRSTSGRRGAGARVETGPEMTSAAKIVRITGITGPLSRIDALTAKAAREVLDTNVFGAFLCARAAVARISTRQGGAGGAMVFISSAMATLGGAGEYVMYAASKGANESLSLGLARELAQEGIRSNVVEPGPIATGLHPAGRLEHTTQAVP